MRNLKLLVLSATFVVATAGLALAGDCDKSASASAAKAKSDCSSTASAQTAAVKSANAEGGCASSASAVKTASAEECAGKATAGAVKVETVRMPSGALAVFYTGSTPESVSFLQASAEKGCTGFACNVTKGMAADANCKVEMAKTEHGVMMLVTSEKAEVLDGYAAQYAAVNAPAQTGAEE